MSAEAINLSGTVERRGISSTSLGMLLTTCIVVAGWVLPLRDYITPRAGLGYWLGILGGSLMVALLIYPLRKRVRLFAFLGSARIWFQIHMVMGVAGPLAILYHCTYRMGATNSNVALWSMIIVASSGLVGRYLYSRIHFGLYGSRANLDEIHFQASKIRLEGTGAGRLLPGFAERLDEAEKSISFSMPLVPKALSALLFWLSSKMRVRVFIRRSLNKAATSSKAVADQKQKLLLAAQRYAEARLAAARRVAEFQSCEKLFGLWHLLHLPLFGMLFVAGIVHVIAVNLY
ncbi:MAG: hypothetical protein WCP04_12485 [Pseudomonadota bacterium]|jgi:hypothetical protein